MYLTNYSEKRVLQTFKGVNLPAPPNVFVACFISNPGETGVGTEIAYTGYGRKEAIFSTPSEESTGSTIENIADILFEAAPTASDTITHVGVMDSPTTGNMLSYMTLSEPIKVAAGVAPLIQKEEWKYETSGNFTRYFKEAYLNALFRGVSLGGFTPYIALYDGDPDGGGSELSGGAYARFPIEFSEPAIQESGQTMIRNTQITSSNRATEPWGNWTHTVIFTASSGGQRVVSSPRDEPIILGRTSAAVIPEGGFRISLT